MDIDDFMKVFGEYIKRNFRLSSVTVAFLFFISAFLFTACPENVKDDIIECPEGYHLGDYHTDALPEFGIKNSQIPIQNSGDFQVVKATQDIFDINGAGIILDIISKIMV